MNKILETESICLTKQELFEIKIFDYLRNGLPKSIVIIILIFYFIQEDFTPYIFVLYICSLTILLFIISLSIILYRISIYKFIKYRLLFYNDKILIEYDDNIIQQFNISNIYKIKKDKSYFYLYTDLFQTALIIPYNCIDKETKEFINNLQIKKNSKAQSFDYKFFIKNFLLYLFFLTSIIPFYGIFVSITFLVLYKFRKKHKQLTFISFIISLAMSIGYIILSYSSLKVIDNPN